MIYKGGYSLVAMLVINPVAILFYQACSQAPISHASTKTPVQIERKIASEAKVKIVAEKTECLQDEKGQTDCIKSE